MESRVEFVDAELGDDSFYIQVDGERRPFLGFGPVRSTNIKGVTHLVCCVKIEVDDEDDGGEEDQREIYYSISIDGGNPPPDDWFSQPVGIIRLNNGGVRCRVPDKGRFTFSWPAHTR